MKYAIWSAVSSQEQAADDKDSLATQIAACREVGRKAGGIEAAIYVADGYSRSFYDGLSDAMADIPALKEMIEAADKHEFDVVICYYYERFGDIAKNVLTRLSRLKIQFVSVNEPIPIIAPELYEPSRDQTRAVLVAMSDVKNNYRISRIVNNFRDAMPSRIKNGLRPGGPVHFGYRWVSAKEPLQQDPEQCAKLLQAKQMLFDGATYTAIGEYLGMERQAAILALTKPFYAGLLVHNRTTTNGEVRIPNPHHKWITGEGKHVPLWTVVEHEAILAEIERRGESLKKNGIRHIFSGLLFCDICGASMKRNKYGSVPVVHCTKHGAQHVALKQAIVYPRTVTAIQDEMRKYKSGGVDADEADKSDVLKRAIDEKKKKRRKIQEGYEAELYSAIEASKLLKELDKETERLDKDLERLSRAKQEKRVASDTMEQLMEEIEFFPIWLERVDVKVGNRLLSAWLKQIRINADGVKIVRR